MNRSVRYAALALLAALPVIAQAKKLHVSAIEQTLPALPLQEHYTAEGRWTAQQLPLSLYGLRAAVLPGTPEQRARQFLGEHVALLGLRDAQLNDLGLVWTRASKSGVNVHFEQRVQGVPVYGSRTVVHISRANAVTQVLNGYKRNAVLDSVQPLVGAQQARAAALQRLGAVEPLRYDDTRLVVYAQDAVPRLAWRVRVVAAHPLGDWEALVDARSGAIFVLWDRSAYADAPAAGPRGSIFDPDPLSSSHTAYGAPMADNNDADDAAINAQIRVVDLGNISFENGEYLLKSEWAEITDHETPSNGLFAQASPDFIFTREPDGFEAVNTFWHIQESMEYINHTLGIALRPYQYSGGVQFDPQGLDGEDNSHYDSSTGQLAFGEGCVDDDEDADVIRHELGHGLHDWVTNGGLSNLVDGLSEGFGDYWAQSYSRSLHQWQPGEPAYDWVYSWDGHNECWDGRVTNYATRWPLGMKPYPLIHESGQMISTCLMKIYDQIGREKTDAMSLEGLAMTGEFSSQNDAANGMVQAAQDMGYSSAEVDTISSTFSGCGYIIAPVFPLPLTPASEGATSDKAEGPYVGAGVGGSRYGGALGVWLLLPLLLMRRLRRS